MKKVFLKPKREKSVVQHHPWIFSGSIGHTDPSLEDGEVVSVHDHTGNMLGTGYFNSRSRIRIRMLIFGTGIPDSSFFRESISRAYLKRTTNPLLKNTDSCRIVNSEGDHIPGLIIDSFNGHVVVQLLTKGIETFRDKIINAVMDVIKPISIYERSDNPGRSLEGIAPRCTQVYGKTPERIVIHEEDMCFTVDVLKGQKTGFFLDQRDNRKLIRSISEKRSVLNLFSYTGGFSIAALKGEATDVISVDSSEQALLLLQNNLDKNGFTGAGRLIREDVFSYIRNNAITSNVIIVDPPALAKSRDSVSAACRGYKDLNYNIARRCPPESIILTCSCSRFIDMDLFQKIVFSAILDSGRNASIIAKTHQPADHPVSIFCPETEYLKSLLIFLD